MKIFEEFWYGNIVPYTDCRKNTKEMKEQTEKLSSYYDKLLKELNDEQKSLLEAYDECLSSISEINEKETFEYAFSLGTKIAISELYK